MRMNQESRCPGEYYSSNLYCKRYPRKTRCIIKSGNIFCSRMCQRQNAEWSSNERIRFRKVIMYFLPSPRAHSQIIAFFGLLKYFQTCIFHFLHFIRIFFIQLHRKKISRCYLVLRICTLNYIARGLYIIFILKIEKKKNIS